MLQSLISGEKVKKGNEMLRNVIVLMLMLAVFCPAAYAKKHKGCDKEKKQSTFVKQICSKKNLEEAINEWATANPTYEMESMTYYKKCRNQCVLIIYEIDD